MLKRCKRFLSCWLIDDLGKSDFLNEIRFFWFLKKLRILINVKINWNINEVFYSSDEKVANVIEIFISSFGFVGSVFI